ncbi:MAG: thiopurine S-methyltransferase [Pseudomonadota bacterium]
MDNDFWLARWQRGETAFHQDTVNRWLERQLAALMLQPGDTVFLPLCGKTRDLRFLADRGFRVTGVELSPLAVETFFREQQLQPTVRKVDGFTVHECGNLRLLCGDFFRLTPELLGPVAAVFDRAALVALPPAMRADYAARLLRLLPAGARILLVSFDYPQAEMDGPPFSVPQAEIRSLFGNRCDIAALGREDLLATEERFRARGLSRLHETGWLLMPRPA